MKDITQRVFITGDFVMDHHIYEGQRHDFGDHRSRGVREVRELGGAALLHRLLAELNFRALSLGVPGDCINTGNIPDELKSYAFWRPFLRKERDPESAVWRAAEKMGFGAMPASSSVSSLPFQKLKCDAADIIVISEGGMGFRREDPSWIVNAAPGVRWIVLKAAHPLLEGELWKTLAEKACRDKLVVIASAEELRKGTAQISTGVSWEETLESLFRELKPGGALAELAQCRHLVIAFDSDGGLWIDQRAGRAHFVYEAASAEGESRHACKGTSFGMLSCLAAAVVWRLAADGDARKFEVALESGLSAMRDLLENGHGRAAAVPDGFPAKRLAKVITEATCRYSRAVFSPSSIDRVPPCMVRLGNDFPADAKLPIASDDPVRCWSIMHEALEKLGQECPEPAYQLAELVARRGAIALGSLPHLQIGGLMSADRQEIEALRVVRRLVLDYRDSNPGRRPLSIGVFGPPGAGKSFAVKQITKALLDEKGWMEFNLSQFKEGTDDLIGAFHQIRDRALQGILPVAFFDEFDSREYGWLQYLLAPMQDGAFQEGQITHPIGKCIFVFAGGTSYTFASFGPPEADKEGYARFRLAKGPDFKSRLDGFLDVVGPNQRQSPRLGAGRKRYDLELDPCDIFFPIRRAFMLRSELGLSAVDKLHIDPGLLRALLRVDRYKHGARSLGKVVEPLRAIHPGFLSRSLTPPRNQLALHVDANQFLVLCHDGKATAPDPLSLDKREELADAIHEEFNALGIAEGWLKEAEAEPFKKLSDFLIAEGWLKEGETVPFKKLNDLLIAAGRLKEGEAVPFKGLDGFLIAAGWLKKEEAVPFEKLSDFLRDSNRAAADRMAEILQLIGLRLASGTATDDEAHVRLKIEYHLELLAEAEHDGWMAWHLDRGWQWGPGKKDPEKKTHPCLKPYVQLPDIERNKDRNTIRHYPDFARRANMRIMAVPSPFAADPRPDNFGRESPCALPQSG